MRIVIAQCTLEYSGRGKTVAAPATRVILIKNDKSVVVHQANKNIKPINYMKGTKHTVIEYDGEKITVSNRVEKLFITLQDTLSDLSYDVDTDDKGLERLGTESDVQEYLAENRTLVSPFVESAEREVRLGGQPVDIICRERSTTHLVEVKREARASAVVWQIIKYAEAYGKENEDKPQLVLAALSITKRVREECEEHDIRCLEIDRNDFEKWLENKSKESQKEADSLVTDTQNLVT